MQTYVYQKPFHSIFQFQVGHSIQKRLETEERKFPCVYMYVVILVTAMSSRILKAKQKLGSDKLGGIAFTKISKMTMCSA